MKTMPGWFAFLLIASSCVDITDSGSGLVGDNNYLPLSIGNYWDFIPIDAKAGSPVIEHREVKSEVTIGSQSYFMVVSTFRYQNERSYDTSYYRVEDNGYVYILRNNNDNEAQEFRLYGSDGYSWTYTFEDDGREYATNIYLTETTITIGYTTLANCKEYFRDVVQWADEEHSITLAPGIGFVREYSTAWGGGQVLKSASINGTVRTFQYP